MIQGLSGSWCIKGTGESMTRVDSPVPLMHHDTDRPWITDPDPDHPKGMHPKSGFVSLANSILNGGLNPESTPIYSLKTKVQPCGTTGKGTVHSLSIAQSS